MIPARSSRSILDDPIGAGRGRPYFPSVHLAYQDHRQCKSVVVGADTKSIPEFSARIGLRADSTRLVSNPSGAGHTI
jgi:hypothetical protein